MIRPIVVVSGPSGGGKSTILDRAIRSYPESFAFSVSYTTRQPRGQERNGVEYWFVSREEMEKMIETNEFLEYAEFGGNLYGTSRKIVKELQTQKKICLLDLELQGVLSMRASDLPAKYILIRPPSLKIVENRLRMRETDTEEAIQKRLKQAELDWKHVDNDPAIFDKIIINDEAEKAYMEFIDFLECYLNYHL